MRVNPRRNPAERSGPPIIFFHALFRIAMRGEVSGAELFYCVRMEIVRQVIIDARPLAERKNNDSEEKQCCHDGKKHVARLAFTLNKAVRIPHNPKNHLRSPGRSRNDSRPIFVSLELNAAVGHTLYRIMIAALFPQRKVLPSAFPYPFSGLPGRAWGLPRRHERPDFPTFAWVFSSLNILAVPCLFDHFAR